jgi:1-acyl-sn-glycerol-3-phosphate acyltransferase
MEGCSPSGKTGHTHAFVSPLLWAACGGEGALTNAVTSLLLLPLRFGAFKAASSTGAAPSPLGPGCGLMQLCVLLLCFSMLPCAVLLFSGASVVPITINGTGEVMPKGRELEMRTGRITIHVCAPLIATW